MTIPKKVVHLTTVHHPSDPRIYHKECLSLKRAGYDVTLIAQQDEETTEKEKPIRHIPLKTYKNRIKRMLFGTFDLYRKAKKLKADVYHFHDPELLPIGWLLKKNNNTVIYDIHEDYVTSILQKEYMSPFFQKLFAKMYKTMENIFSRKMELCLAEKYYKDIYPTGKCILNYPTINEKFLKHDRKNQPLKNAVLYTGNVTEDRGALIHARLPQIDESLSVQFIGKCPSDLAEEMYSVAGNRSGQLLIEGIDKYIEKEAIEAMYVEHNWLAGVALFPPTDHYMKKELTKFFEYMNAGLPIICSNFPVWERFIDQYKCGIAVDPYDSSAVEKAIRYLRDHPEEARQMGENGKQAVQQELNWLSEEKKLIQWYQQLLQENSTILK